MRRSTRIKAISEPKTKSPKRKKLRTLVVDEESSENLSTTSLVTRIKKTGRNPKNIISPKLFGQCETIPSSIADLKFKAECESEEEKVQKIPRPEKFVDLVSNLNENIDIIFHGDNSTSKICNPQHQDESIKTKQQEKDDSQSGSLKSREDGNSKTVENSPSTFETATNIHDTAITDTQSDDNSNIVSEECIIQDENVERGVAGNIQGVETVQQDTIALAENKKNIEVDRSVEITKSVGPVSPVRSSKINENVEEDMVGSVKDIDLAEHGIDSSPENERSIVADTADAVVERSSKYTVEISKKEATYNLFKVGFDLTQYKNMDFDKFAGNPLMETLFKLKQSFPFREYLQVKCTAEKNIVDSSKSDILSLDNVSFVNETPASKNTSKLSSQVHVPINPELYFDISAVNSRKMDSDKDVEKLMKKSVLPDDLERMEMAPKLYVSKNLEKSESKRKQEETAGKGWYNLPKTEVTDTIKKDLQLLKMRSALDSKHHYKRNDTNKFPKYFQMGTVVEGAHEFYSGRIPKSDRKRTMVDELLEDAEFRRKNKKKFIDICKKQVSGSKGFYKKLKNKKKATWERT